MVSEKTAFENGELRSREEIPDWELAVLDVFVRGAAMLGLRKSFGLVYGALYCSREPLATADLQKKLQLSRGAVVEAVQFLRRLGAVRIHLKIGERRDFFSAETDLKKFARGFLKEILEPALEKAELRLAQAKTSAGTANGKRGDAFARSRIAGLTAWKSRFSEIVPLFENFLGEESPSE